MSAPQQSEEWFKARLGRITASRINDVMSVVKSGESASRRDYRMQLFLERVTGRKEETYTNAYMQRGTELEPKARANYEFMYDVEVKEVGFIDHPTMEMTGCSCDGTIGNDGLIEIKVPKSSTYWDWLSAGVVPEEHKNQMLWQMECTGRKWCDFVAYDDRFPASIQLFVKRYHFDEDRAKLIRAEVKKMEAEITAMVIKMRELEAR